MQNLNILAINPGHNSSAALVSNGELIFYAEEERFSRQKYDGNPFRAMLQILVNYPINEFIIGGTSNQHPQLTWTGEDPYSALVRKFNPGVNITLMGHLHHMGHAAAAFYNSGFTKATVIIVDGAGSYHQEQMWKDGPTTGGFETESIYHCSYPHEFNALYKRYSDGKSIYFDNGIQEFDGSVTITKAYEAVSQYLGFGFIEAGKTMGLSAYGKSDNDIPLFFISGKGNKNLLLPSYPAGAFIDENRFPYLKHFNQSSEWHKDSDLVSDIDKNIAYAVQRDTEEQVIELIRKAIDITGDNNIVISGGFGLNCVANYKYLKEFSKIKFHIDPIAHDGGSAIGLAKHLWYIKTLDETIRPLKSIYLGTNPNYNELDMIKENVPNIQIVDTTIEDIVKLLDSGNIVVLFQGRSEGGPRALGNRSILFDPRRTDGKAIVNLVKKREWFRPFAGTVLEEYAKDWFEMLELESSPFMMYAVKVKSDKLESIPSITHIDGTCRIQTLNKEQNENFYNLIKIFTFFTDIIQL